MSLGFARTSTTRSVCPGGDSARSPAEGKIRRLRVAAIETVRASGRVGRAMRAAVGLGWWEAYVLTFRGDACARRATFRRFAGVWLRHCGDGRRPLRPLPPGRYAHFVCHTVRV